MQKENRGRRRRNESRRNIEQEIKTEHDALSLAAADAEGILLSSSLRSCQEPMSVLADHLPADLLANLSEITCVYEGAHNVTFRAMMNNIGLVQIRLPKHNYIHWRNESRVLRHQEGLIYYRNGVLVRRWETGVDLRGNVLTLDQQRELVVSLKRFILSQRNATQLRFDWVGSWITTARYYEVLIRLQRVDTNLVFSHGDLVAKNILRLDHGGYFFIDFEYARLNTRYWDPITLYDRMHIDKHLLIQEFELDEQMFDDYYYLYRVFVDAWTRGVEYKRSLPYYQLTPIDTFFLQRNTQYNPHGLSADNFAILRREVFAPDVIAITEEYYLLRWYPRVNWYNSELQPRFVGGISHILERLQRLPLRDLPTLAAEIRRLEQLCRGSYTLSELLPYQQEIWEHINLLENSERKSITIPYLTPRSLVINTQQISKFLELDKLIIGHPCLGWVAIWELDILNAQNKRMLRKMLHRDYADMLCSAHIALLYYSCLYNTTIGNYLALENTLPRTIYNVILQRAQAQTLGG